MRNEIEKAFNYLHDAVTVSLPPNEISRRAKLLIKACNNEQIPTQQGA